MRSAANVLTADRATIEGAEILVPFGLTERQARFLATVMVHSGVFVGRQYAAFAGITHGQKVHDFLEQLLVTGRAPVQQLPRRWSVGVHEFARHQTL